METDYIKPAREFADRFGCAVFPVQGKRPVVGVQWKKSTPDPLNPWTTEQWEAATGYGYIAGPSLLILDIDDPNEVPYFLKEAIETNPTWSAATPGGPGRHRYIYKNTLGLKRKKAVPFGHLIVGSNYAVGSGSRHPNGDTYSAPYQDIALADAPQAILRVNSPDVDFINDHIATEYGEHNPAPHGMHDDWLSAHSARRALQIKGTSKKNWETVKKEVKKELEYIIDNHSKFLLDYNENNPYTERDFDRLAHSAMRGAKRLRKKELKEESKRYLFIEKEGRPDYTARVLERHLDILGYKIRFNIRAKKPEVWSKRNPEWIWMTDRLEAAIFNEIHDYIAYYLGSDRGYSGMKVYTDDRRTATLALLSYNEVDPFLVWLEELPEWDQVARLDFLMENRFALHPETDMDIARWVSRAPLLAAVWRAYQPGYFHDEVPILIGKSDAGKSRFFQHLFPDKWQSQWYTPGIDFSASHKQFVEATDGKVICEYAELVGMKRAEIEKLKSIITTQADNAVRTAYARNAEERDRRFVLVGTSNDYNCLPNDPEGLRRFIPIVIEGGDSPATIDYLAQNREQIWAETLHRYKEGELSRLPKHLKVSAASAAEDHRDANMAVENLVASLIAGNKKNINIVEVIQTAYDLNGLRITSTEVAKALRNAGYRSKRVTINGVKSTVWNPEGN